MERTREVEQAERGGQEWRELERWSKQREGVKNGENQRGGASRERGSSLERTCCLCYDCSCGVRPLTQAFDARVSVRTFRPYMSRQKTVILYTRTGSPAVTGSVFMRRSRLYNYITPIKGIYSMYSTKLIHLKIDFNILLLMSNAIRYVHTKSSFVGKPVPLYMYK